MQDIYTPLQLLRDADPEYQALYQTHLEATSRFRQFLNRLEPTDREIIYEYLGALGEMQMREIELALMMKQL